MVPTGPDFGLADWINYSKLHFQYQKKRLCIHLNCLDKKKLHFISKELSLESLLYWKPLFTDQKFYSWGEGYFLIHSAGSDNFFWHMLSVRTSVHPSPLFKSRKTKQQKTMFATGSGRVDHWWHCFVYCILQQHRSLAKWKVLQICNVFNNLAKKIFQELQKITKKQSTVSDKPEMTLQKFFLGPRKLEVISKIQVFCHEWKQILFFILIWRTFVLQAATKFWSFGKIYCTVEFIIFY